MPHAQTSEAIREGRFTKYVEQRTARIPSGTFLALALGSVAFSAFLEAFGGHRRREPGTFVGLWAPTLLLLGIYNKLVKLEGSDRFDRPSAQTDLTH